MEIEFSDNITAIAEVLNQLKTSSPFPSDASKAFKVVKENIVRKARSITPDGRKVERVIYVSF